MPCCLRGRRKVPCSSSSKLHAQEQKHEAALKDLRERIAKTRKALQDTVDKKKVLERSAQ